MNSRHNRFSLLNDEEVEQFEDDAEDTLISIAVAMTKKKSKKRKKSKNLTQDIPNAASNIHNTPKLQFTLLPSIFWSFFMYTLGYVLLRKKSELYSALLATFSYL